MYVFVPNVVNEDLIQLKRRTIESLYFARVTVTTTENEKDNATGFMREHKRIICEDEPCRITSQLADPVDGNPKAYIKRINLMLAPEWDIPQGSVIEVTYNGYTKKYKMSAPPYHYSDHQTISLLEYTEEGNQYA